MHKDAVIATQLLQARLEALLLQVGSDWVVKGLAAVAALMALVVAERLLYFWWSGENVESLRKLLGDMLKRHQLSRAEQLLKKRRSAAARIAAQALGRLEHGPAAVEEVIAGARSLERLKLERGVGLLSLLALVAIGLGAVGTLVGLVAACAAGPALALPRAATALTLAAAGAAVAFPNFLAYRIMQGIVRRRLARADALARVLLAYAKTRR